MKTATAWVGVVAVALLSTGCGQNSSGRSHGISLVSAGKLTICTHLPYRPFEFTNKQGKVVGFDVDMLRLLAGKLDVEPRVISVAWSTVTSGAVFKANKCDLAMGGSTITPERQKTVQFSDPYFESTQALIARTDSDVESLTDLENKRLGVQTETTGKRYAESHQAQYGYEVVIFDDISLETAAVSAGKVAAGLSDNSALSTYVKTHADTHVVQKLKTGEQYGFIVQKDNANADKLVQKLNQVIATAKRDGTYKRIFRKWFGQSPGPVD